MKASVEIFGCLSSVGADGQIGDEPEFHRTSGTVNLSQLSALPERNAGAMAFDSLRDRAHAVS